MAENIAVIGNSDSVDYFRILGCKVYKTKNGELAENIFQEVIERRFKIILVTEEVFGKYKSLIRDKARGVFPVISVIPDIHGAKWKDDSPVLEGVAFRELREAVIKAVGQDISGTAE